eukprot:scaffold2830_cov131-Cylindrotheca_fusiformis.AAC.3
MCSSLCLAPPARDEAQLCSAIEKRTAYLKPTRSLIDPEDLHTSFPIQLGEKVQIPTSAPACDEAQLCSAIEKRTAHLKLLTRNIFPPAL